LSSTFGVIESSQDGDYAALLRADRTFPEVYSLNGNDPLEEIMTRLMYPGSGMDERHWKHVIPKPN